MRRLFRLVAFSIFAVALIGNIWLGNRAVWHGMLCYAAVLVCVLLLVPMLTVIALLRLKQKQVAARYAAWVARHLVPFPAQRRACAMLAAQIYAELGDKARATKYAEQGAALCETHLDNPRVRATYALCLNVLGMLALCAGRYREALDAFGRPLRMGLEHPLYAPLFHVNCAAALHSLGQFDESVQHARHALALAPAKHPQVAALAHCNAALSLIELGRSQEALAETTAALAVPKLMSTHRALALVFHAWSLWKAGDAAGAQVAFAEAERTLPSQDAALRQRWHTLCGRMRLEQGELDDALVDLRAALTGPDAAPQVLYSLYQLAVRRGDAAQAAEWRERLRRDVPESFWAARAVQETASGV